MARRRSRPPTTDRHQGLPKEHAGSGSASATPGSPAAQAHDAMEGIPDFSDESVRALWARFTQSRELALRVRLIERYLALARSTAARFYRLRADDSVPFEDYLQYARIGLVEAIDDYDPGREASFETYSSYRIRGAVLNGLGRESEVAAQRSFWRTRTQEVFDVGASAESVSTGGANADGAEDEGAAEELTSSPTGPLALGFLLEHDHDDVADEAVQANPHVAVEQVELLALIGLVLDKLPERERQLI